MTEKRLGKITKADFGFTGYQECEFGLALTFEGESWGVCTMVSGGWAYGRIDVTDHTKWTEADRSEKMAAMCKKVAGILQDAKVENVSDLKNIPVEVEFDFNTIKDWRILKEVL